MDKGHECTLEETWLDHLIYSAVTSTKLLLHCEEQQKG